MNRSVMNVVCFEWSVMSGLLWTGPFWTDASRDYLALALKSSGDSRQKIEGYVVTDLDLCKDENRPNSTSSAVAEERQDV